MENFGMPDQTTFGAVALQKTKIENTIRRYLDQSIPYFTYRWAATAGLFIIFAARILLARGWYIVAYTLGIYLLNKFLAFLTPKLDPANDSALEEGGDIGTLPTRGDQEFVPFIRQLPEFKFWQACTTAILSSIVAALIPLLDLPVFWPILVFYWIVLFGVTMQKQIQHMIKYRYIPWDFGKKKFGSRKL